MSLVSHLDEVPTKTQKGSQFIAQPKQFTSLKLSVQLRRLLILVDGEKSMLDLLSKGITGINEESFDTLLNHGLIAFSKASMDVPVEPTKPNRVVNLVEDASEKSFTTTRYVLLDVLIDLSMKDFSVRPWINDFETAASVNHLKKLVYEFAQSEEGRLYSETTEELIQLVG